MTGSGATTGSGPANGSGGTAGCSPHNTKPGQNLISNNKILVSILQAFGVNENSFGTATDPAITTGTLAELEG